MYVTLAPLLVKALAQSWNCELHWMINVWSLLGLALSKVSGSWSLVAGAEVDLGVTRVWARREMAVARLPVGSRLSSGASSSGVRSDISDKFM